MYNRLQAINVSQLINQTQTSDRSSRAIQDSSKYGENSRQTVPVYVKAAFKSREAVGQDPLVLCEKFPNRESTDTECFLSELCRRCIRTKCVAGGTRYTRNRIPD